MLAGYLDLKSTVFYCCDMGNRAPAYLLKKLNQIYILF